MIVQEGEDRMSSEECCCCTVGDCVVFSGGGEFRDWRGKQAGQFQ